MGSRKGGGSKAQGQDPLGRNKCSRGGLIPRGLERLGKEAHICSCYL